MGRLKKVEREQASPEVAAIYDKYLQERGNVPNAFKTLAQVPIYLTTLIDHYRTVMLTGKVPLKLKELLFVKVSQVNSCNYCLSSHIALAKQIGYSDEQIQRLKDYAAAEQFNPAVKSALKLAEKMTLDAHQVHDEDVEELKHYYSEREIIELACVIGLANYFNRFTTAFRIDLSGTDAPYESYSFL